MADYQEPLVKPTDYQEPLVKPTDYQNQDIKKPTKQRVLQDKEIRNESKNPLAKRTQVERLILFENNMNLVEEISNKFYGDNSFKDDIKQTGLVEYRYLIVESYIFMHFLMFFMKINKKISTI